MAHVGILFCLYDHLKQLKEENIMAYLVEVAESRDKSPDPLKK